jgi:hypothetical protein
VPCAAGGLFRPEESEGFFARDFLLIGRGEEGEQRETPPLCRRTGYNLAVGVKSQAAECKKAKAHAIDAAIDSERECPLTARR